MRIFNADGSEVDACGNATRCITLFLGRDCRIETNAGLLNAELHGEGASVDMGQPRFGWVEIPLGYARDTLTRTARWGDLPVLDGRREERRGGKEWGGTWRYRWS